MVRSQAYTSRPRTEWFQRIAPSIVGTNVSSNVYEMVHPAALTDEIAESGMAPVLQIGRMDVPDESEAEWNGFGGLSQEWSGETVSSPEITADIPGALGGAEIQINGPSSAPRLKLSQVRMAVQYDAAKPAPSTP